MTTSQPFRAFGLGVRVDIAVAGAQPTETVDVNIRRGGVANGPSLGRGSRSTGWPRVAVQGDDVVLYFEDEIVASFNRHSRVIEYATAESVDSDSLQHALLDHVLPRFVALNGGMVLHAGAVAVEGGAGLLLGASGSGKSTLTAALGIDGYSVLTDDAAMLVALSRGEFAVEPAFSTCRLTASSIDALFGAGSARPRPEATTGKHRVHIAGPRSGQPSSPSPVRGIIDLAYRDHTFALERLGPAEAFSRLSRQSFDVFGTVVEARVAALDKWSPVCASVPVFRLVRPHGLEHLRRSVEMVRRVLDGALS